MYDIEGELDPQEQEDDFPSSSQTLLNKKRPKTPNEDGDFKDHRLEEIKKKRKKVAAHCPNLD